MRYNAFSRSSHLNQHRQKQSHLIFMNSSQGDRVTQGSVNYEFSWTFGRAQFCRDIRPAIRIEPIVI